MGGGPQRTCGTHLLRSYVLEQDHEDQQKGTWDELLEAASNLAEVRRPTTVTETDREGEGGATTRRRRGAGRGGGLDGEELEEQPWDRGLEQHIGESIDDN